MPKYNHGLIIGKFYPPHNGHVKLITKAAKSCHLVTVVVAANSIESILLSDRVKWLAEATSIYPNVTVIGKMDNYEINYNSDQVWQQHTNIFLEAARETAPKTKIDVVFSGESYGHELAKRLHAKHSQLVRSNPNECATVIRENLFANWQHLPYSTKSGLAIKIVIVGAESTGTTTLAYDLAKVLHAPYVPEYGRTYTAVKLARARQTWLEPTIKDLVWHTSEFGLIASKQSMMIDKATKSSPIVVCDTDALATSVWHDRYVGGENKIALTQAKDTSPSIYLLTTPHEVPFTQDGLRDGEHLRETMTDMFIKALNNSGVPWYKISGTPKERIKLALKLLQPITKPPVFAKPLG